MILAAIKGQEDAIKMQTNDAYIASKSTDALLLKSLTFLRTYSIVLLLLMRVHC